MRFTHSIQQAIAPIMLSSHLWIVTEAHPVDEQIVFSLEPAAASSCPDSVLKCGANDCRLKLSLHDTSKPVCTGKYEGCECLTEEDVGSGMRKQNPVTNAVTDNFSPAVKATHPTYPLLECSQEFESVNVLDFWQNLGIKFGWDLETSDHKWDLYVAKEHTYGEKYGEMSVEFEWRSYLDVACTTESSDMIWDGLANPPCRPDDYTVARSASLKFDCGEVKYRIHRNKPASRGPVREPPLDTVENAEWEHKGGNLYSGFCAKIKREQPLKMTVYLQEQGLLPHQDFYLQSNIELSWKPGSHEELEAGCGQTCEEAMHIFRASSLGRLGDDKSLMARAASYDVGCGTYSYVFRDGTESL
ncbi:hypothetical protein BGZ61DRAFT_576882 [Ilyonectria robusta]|uniref:uncharacterized protein n=1 Tax=Ilyonectria robusta TaxID=1079257 RepID=UPI001E8E6B10|nr:uncharacterized protein BGZ61DRAFT_576882 [Ilyonectria robusta]KAH8699514.1 hypothetical protein BGZ61DRAFT_576882 [Ilyonectria robusta]